MQDRIDETLNRLRPWQMHGGVLEIGEPYHMLVLVAISARTRDEQVLKLAPAFFAAFPTVRDLAQGTVDEITQKLGTIGLYKQKAKNLKAMAQKLLSDFGGEVPRTIEELTTLPGVGRKTASVVLAAAFDIPAIAVDTHVFRVIQRLGWAKATTPEALEKRLRKLVPEERWTEVNQVFVPFGRAVCTPGVPRCWTCPLRDLCDYRKKKLEPPENAEDIERRIAAQQENLARLKAEAALC